MKDFKNKITNYCSIAFVIGIAITGATTQVKLPAWLIGIGGLLTAISGAIIGYFTGKNPDGTIKKSPQNQ